MKYQIVEKMPGHFEVQYRDLWRWRCAHVFTTLFEAKAHIERQKALRRPSTLIHEEGEV